MATTLAQQTWAPFRGFDDTSPEHNVSMDMATNAINVEIMERAIKKRQGTEKVNSTIITATATVLHMDTLNLSNGTSTELVYTSDGNLRNQADLTGSIIPGFATGEPIYSTQILDTMIFAQGATAMRTYDGSTTGIITASPFGKYLETHLEKLWTAGIDGQLSLVSCSATGDVHTWAGSGTADINISQNDGTVITGIKALRSDLIVYKEKSVYKIIGFSSDTFQAIQVDKNYGCVAQRTIQDCGDFHLFAGTDGLYMCDGNRVAKVSGYQDTIWSTRNKTRSEYMTSTLFKDNGEYIVSFATGSATTNTITLVYYYDRAWTDEMGQLHLPCAKWTGIEPASLHTSVITASKNPIMYIGDYSGYIKKRTPDEADDGAEIESYIDSPMVEGSSVATTVNLRRMFVPVVNNPGDISAYYSTQENTTSWVLAESMAGAAGSLGDEIGITFEIGVSSIGSADPDSRIERVNFNGVQARRVKVRLYQKSDIRTWEINNPIELFMKERGHAT
jgi:hypothetical protein